jgi:two-component system NtrC family sensor kinase
MQQLTDRNGCEQLESMLAAEREERTRLQQQLDLRDCALNAAKTQFLIIEVCGPSWTIKYANRAFAEDHGYELAELLGQDPSMLSPAETNTVASERIRNAMREGTAVSTELIACRKDGSTFWVGMFMAPLRNAAGVVTHYVVTAADITAKLAQERAQRQLQEQLYSEMQERERMAIELRLAQKLESVGRLAAGIAHEINTPIQYIGDSVTFLQSTQLDLERLLVAYRDALQEANGDQRLNGILVNLKEMEKSLDLEFLTTETSRAFERTLEGVERVAAIVRAMKEFAHPDSAEHSSADLNHAIETTLTVARNEYKYTAQIEMQLGDIPLVTCNVGELNQVFLNLIVNAAHAIAESGKDAAAGRITIATVACGDTVSISIADNGCGIPEAHLEKIFDPFFTTKPVGRGTGQGLAIARSIVTEKHGGSIDVQSTVGSGTRFILRLPVAGRSSPKST